MSSFKLTHVEVLIAKNQGYINGLWRLSITTPFGLLAQWMVLGHQDAWWIPSHDITVGLSLWLLVVSAMYLKKRIWKEEDQWKKWVVLAPTLVTLGFITGGCLLNSPFWVWLSFSVLGGGILLQKLGGCIYFLFTEKLRCLYIMLMMSTLLGFVEVFCISHCLNTGIAMPLTSFMECIGIKIGVIVFIGLSLLAFTLAAEKRQCNGSDTGPTLTLSCIDKLLSRQDQQDKDKFNTLFKELYHYVITHPEVSTGLCNITEVVAFINIMECSLPDFSNEVPEAPKLSYFSKKFI